MQSQMLLFLSQYIKNPNSIGAILPSSKYVVEKMIEKIDFDKAKYLAEYGPGTGVITEKLIKARKKDTLLMLFENNKKFCDLLKKKYRGEPNLLVINQSPKCMEEYLIKHNIPWLDYVISSIPLTNMPIQEATSILYVTKKHFLPTSSFITCQYSTTKKGLFSTYFKKIEITSEIKNIPPAYILHCSISR
ncbi:Phospholipid N-methyltransferase [Paenibacillus sp. UNCCL117]|uniref:class I SAM-dependent methyltransferase n=1 Tax=unclassified Paenibacillus TaxID=185978 RepID=UPI00088AF316|nr:MULTISPECIES: rRNA adenine N-6-methyltransferase family protein [unclassified Paenibacillus]SDD32864.1 Phospholipid N-methyltransferase [Paenibacillus sp. cl123]SFW39713.1 Phospholipid N-methyltransferase [Paenibacillus sp. UNCCL117]